MSFKFSELKQWIHNSSLHLAIMKKYILQKYNSTQHRRRFISNRKHLMENFIFPLFAEKK